MGQTPNILSNVYNAAIQIHCACRLPKHLSLFFDENLQTLGEFKVTLGELCFESVETQ